MKQVAVIALVAACSAPAKSPDAPATAPAPKRDLAVAEAPPKQPVPPDPLLDPNDPSARGGWVLRGTQPDRRNTLEGPTWRRFTSPQEIDVAERDLWSPCVRDFVQARPAHARRPLTAAFARYEVTCDPSKGVIVDAPRDYRDKPHVVLRGSPLAGMELDVTVCGVTPARDVVTISYDGKRWTGSGTSERAGSCTITSIPDMRSLRRVLRDVVDAKDAVAMFDGNEIAITDEMKRDLRLMLDALDALSVR